MQEANIKQAVLTLQSNWNETSRAHIPSADDLVCLLIQTQSNQMQHIIWYILCHICVHHILLSTDRGHQLRASKSYLYCVMSICRVIFLFNCYLLVNCYNAIIQSDIYYHQCMSVTAKQYIYGAWIL